MAYGNQRFTCLQLENTPTFFIVATCPSHFNFVDLVTLTVLDERVLDYR